MPKIKPREFGTNWNLTIENHADGTSTADTQTLIAAATMQAVDELRKASRCLNRLVAIFGCSNVQAGFRALRSIARTERLRVKKAVVPKANRKVKGK